MSSYSVVKGTLNFSENYTWNTADGIGRGATAVVYIGRQKVTGQIVAVKVFHDYLRYGYGNEDARELELLRKLSHKNIISLYAVEREERSNNTVVVMEYCAGGSIHSMLGQAQYYYGLPEEQFMLVLFHVAAGVEYLRRSGVVHRDIKPGNIMRYITEDGISIYKLTDFGAARHLSDDEHFTSVHGTEEYLHPWMYEKAVLRMPANQQFDARVDLWSLGVTFYHVATGQLPFQPYGGRVNKETMYSIVSKKESGVISGIQRSENGPIEWSRELPATCMLSNGVRQLITPMLAGLMEADPLHMWSFETFFSFASQLQNFIKLFVFHYTEGAVYTVFLEPSATLSGVQDAIASMTDLPASQQLLLVAGHDLMDVVNPLTPLISFPTHIKDSTIYLFPKGSMPEEPPQLAPLKIPIIPEFSNSVNISKDQQLAWDCQAFGCMVKQLGEKVCEQQKCLVEGQLFLRTYVEMRLHAAGEAVQLIEMKILESKKRLATFYDSLRFLQTFLMCLSGKNNSSFTDILQDDTVLQVHSKAEERVGEIARYKQGLQEKLMTELRAHSSQWSEQCKQSSCTSRIGHLLSEITAIQGRFRRDKNVEDQMTSHDKDIHRLERQKLQETCIRMLSLLTGHCIPAFQLLYKQAYFSSWSLIKLLNRVCKVEMNNKCVVNCQQQLSNRLDKMGEKCMEETALLQTQFQSLRRHSTPTCGAVANPPTVLGAAARATTFTESLKCRNATASKVPADGSLQSLMDSMHTMRMDSEEILLALKENLDIMKRLEREADKMGTGSYGTVSKRDRKPP